MYTIETWNRDGHEWIEFENGEDFETVKDAHDTLVAFAQDDYMNGFDIDLKYRILCNGYVVAENVLSMS